VTVDGLAGTWVISKGSKAILPVESGKANGRLSLARDGGFVAEGIPGELLYSPPGVKNTAPVSGSGTWKLHEVDGSPALLLAFDVFMPPNEKMPRSETQIFIDNEWREITLYFFLGDPDQGGRVELERVK